jgi:hypothetical protein
MGMMVRLMSGGVRECEQGATDGQERERERERDITNKANEKGRTIVEQNTYVVLSLTLQSDFRRSSILSAKIPISESSGLGTFTHEPSGSLINNVSV